MAALTLPISMHPRIRRRFQVRGIVQGVGFRPFVHRLASEMALSGWVQNGVSGVVVEAEGSLPQLETFVQRLLAEAPRLARIDEVIPQEVALVPNTHGFEVIKSAHDGALATMIGPDSAICDDCLFEMLTPGDRRYRYPFINCTHCGPRYTLVHGLPYDRATTSMATFAQCPACLAEYTDAAHRRFHAEPNACPQCGPRLQWCDVRGSGDIRAISTQVHTLFSLPPSGGGCPEGAGEGEGLGGKGSLSPSPLSPLPRGERGAENDAIAEALNRIRRGDIVAIKGLGGFHLVCDATCAEAVSELRQRKARDEKPFALMVLNAVSAQQWCDVSEEEAALLESVERPIVLLPKKKHTDKALAGIAPDMNTLGLMLPYTPLHYLLFHEASGRPATLDWLKEAQPLILVMTSANPGGEPLVIGNEEALQRLQGIADGWLMHDREIVARCDDSVVRVPITESKPQLLPPQFIRRARGYTPRAIRLSGAADAPSVLAVGGYFKNTICVTRGDEAFLSPHIGSLDNAATCRAFDEAIEHLLKLLDVTPTCIAHDRHPDFYSTRVAAALAQRFDVPMIEVAHHHAHIAAVVAEHRIDAPVLGLAFDGVGLGDDGTAWGGELLYVGGAKCQGAKSERVGHLTPLYLAGGDKAAREPWRMAASVLAQSGRVGDIEKIFPQQSAAAAVAKVLSRALEANSPHAPPTTSMGRYFDAAAGALKVCEQMTFEGQAAMRLEGLAHRYLNSKQKSHLPVDSSAFLIEPDGTLNVLPLVHALFYVDNPSYGAALFHGTLIAAVVEWADAAARRLGLDQIVCGGGCFVNALLSRGVSDGLRARGHVVWHAQAAPANDGGLSLGQAWVARLHRLG
ncbi:MAG: carbamoyltransferase HypF [Burkholderiales bacterium]|jgi:hydrogenase maturation protein HypF|nr:carbamoyltransferase HypF [Burkholderiales bacterium]